MGSVASPLARDRCRCVPITMCGIIACIRTEETVADLLESLKTLEYRGYDSAGIALFDSDSVQVFKREGDIADLETIVEENDPDGRIGIGHTRWSTHGQPSDANAHPHTDCTGRVAVVHNGIIENYETLKRALVERGHTFTSDTDTEVVPHLLEEKLQRGLEPDAAFRKTIREISGSYAIAMMVAGEPVVYGTRNGSPLVVGEADGEYYLSSDIPGFRRFTDRAIHLEDHDIVTLRPEQCEITDLDGQPVDRSTRLIDWDPEDTEKNGYSHYMLKEIHEQPTALRQTIEGRTGTARSSQNLDILDHARLADIERVVFVGCGTSYHAALYGRTLLHRRHIHSDAVLANEFANEPMPIGSDTLVVAMTQSGETADTLQALRKANAAGAATLAVTNTVGSTAVRVADDTVFIRAGPEIGVAATKTFSSQIAALVILVEQLRSRLVGGSPNDELLQHLRRIPDDIDQILGMNRPKQLARNHRDIERHFFIGRGIAYPVALEGALKFKEITYGHAEGFAAGELKHGPLALITEESIVMAIVTDPEDSKTLHNISEVQTRGATVVVVGPESLSIPDSIAAHTIQIPDGPAELTGITANIVLQLFSYHAAELRGRSIDKPRNLAKSVTVE